MSLLLNGLNRPEQPEMGGWGSRFIRRSTGKLVYAEAIDSVGRFDLDPDPHMTTVCRWRPAWQADFAARLDWCVQPYEKANHAPVISLNTLDGKVNVNEMNVAAGEVVRLNAGNSHDPDGDKLQYTWRIYPVWSGLPATPISEQASLALPIPSTWRGRLVPLLLVVTDTGYPPLTAYQRVMMRVK